MDRMRSELVLRNCGSTKLVLQLERIMNVLTRDKHVRIDEVKYILVDRESLGIVSREHKSWMWRYLNVKENEIFCTIL
jgi:hypothetical protein